MSKITPQIRKLILAERLTVQNILPTARQAKIIRYVRSRREATSAELATNFKISLPGARGQLTKLWERGWLERVDVGSDSGGSLYVYTTKY